MDAGRGRGLGLLPQQDSSSSDSLGTIDSAGSVEHEYNQQHFIPEYAHAPDIFARKFCSRSSQQQPTAEPDIIRGHHPGLDSDYNLERLVNAVMSLDQEEGIMEQQEPSMFEVNESSHDSSQNGRPMQKGSSLDSDDSEHLRQRAGSVSSEESEEKQAAGTAAADANSKGDKKTPPRSQIPTPSKKGILRNVTINEEENTVPEELEAEQKGEHLSQWRRLPAEEQQEDVILSAGMDSTVQQHGVSSPRDTKWTLMRKENKKTHSKVQNVESEYATPLQRKEQTIRDLKHELKQLRRLLEVKQVTSAFKLCLNFY